MIYHVIITPEAETDLRTSYCYIRKQAPRAAGDWIRRARQCGKSLARRPERCPLAPENAHLRNPFANCFLARATGELIVPFVVLDRSIGLHTGRAARIHAPAVTRGLARVFVCTDPCPRGRGRPPHTSHYSGIFPCFFAGFLSRFVPSISSAWISFLRVSLGTMTESTNPRSAATYGFAKRSRNSSIFSWRIWSRLAACSRSRL